MQPQINALGIELLEEPTAANREGVGSLPLAAQPQIFDIAANSISGAVPSFLYANNVPAFVRPNVNLRVGLRICFSFSNNQLLSALAFVRICVDMQVETSFLAIHSAGLFTRKAC